MCGQVRNLTFVTFVWYLNKFIYKTCLDYIKPVYISETSKFSTF